MELLHDGPFYLHPWGKSTQTAEVSCTSRSPTWHPHRDALRVLVTRKDLLKRQEWSNCRIQHVDTTGRPVSRIFGNHRPALQSKQGRGGNTLPLAKIQALFGVAHNFEGKRAPVAMRTDLREIPYNRSPK